MNRAAFIALGSNLGDSRANVLAAMEALDRLSVLPLRRSSLWQSTPVDCPAGSPLFVNAVVALDPAAGATPESLLEDLQAIERGLGRRRQGIANEPRPLDLDLLVFGNEVRATPSLTLPHPRTHLRRFVLAPFEEIAPDFILPGQTQTIRELLGNLRTAESVTRLIA